MLTFLHLSDIHFSAFDGPAAQHVDEHVRDLMLEDIRGMAERVGPMDAILVVGDIANTGQEGEYRLAADFLDRVAEIIGCERENVACVPGNHDIDRSAHDAVHAAVRLSLHSLQPEEASARLHTLLREERGSEILLAPLTEYNRFALQYGCAIDRNALAWAPKKFSLAERELVVHGATSAWICDGSESPTDANGVIVGEFQCCSIGRPDTISLAMVHHPSNWVRDRARAQPWLNRAQIILTGHEHATGIDVAENHRRVTIASGAVNPERTERGWIPAYNVMRLALRSETELDLDVFVRCWQRGTAGFGPDERFADPEQIPITLGRQVEEKLEESQLPDPVEVLGPQEPEPIVSNTRTLIFQIMRAPPDARHRAARTLGLVGDADAIGLALDREILAKARQLDRLQELHERIEND